MDYPPLCAYTHKLMAQVVSRVTPNATVLGESYGYQTGAYKVMMRSFVIFWEFLIFVPAIWLVLKQVYP
jgi:alpha-1,3-glucosyltransferase